MAKAGSIKPHTKFKAQVYVLTKEEGGRHTPFYNGYRPQFYLRTTDVTGTISLPDGAEMVMPGDNVEMGVELITPIALEVGQRFAIREGGRTVGAGAITSISGVTPMARVEARPTIQLACTECKERTYTTRKNKKNDPNRIELRSTARACRRHTLHREAK